MKHPGISLIAATIAISAASAVHARDSVAEAIAGGEADLAFRYRVETVDQDGLAESAVASTLRTRLTWKSAQFGAWNASFEIDNVSHLGNDNYNSLRNGKSAYPVVADPRGTGINLANVRYRAGSASAVLGRQRINKDNQRFIGGVGWRQNEQTYDGATFDWSDERLSASYNYLTRVSRVFGPEDGTPAATLDADAHLLHATAKLGGGKVTGYAWLLDFDDAAALSSRTMGASYAARLASGAWQWPVHLEYARQTDYGNQPADFSTGYLHASIGAATGPFSAMLGFERLDTDNDAGRSFSTPLATLHKFNGLTDQFLSTPANGLQDLYLGATWAVPGDGWRDGLSLGGGYHRFWAEEGGAHYGSEWDAGIFKAVKTDYGTWRFGAQFAQYDADRFGADTSKLWLTAAFRLSPAPYRAMFAEE